MTRKWFIGGALILGIVGLFEDGLQKSYFLYDDTLTYNMKIVAKI